MTKDVIAAAEEMDVIAKEKKAVEDLIAIRAITAQNATFSRTQGGFVSMDFAGKRYARVAVHRCFPHSDPTHYISIREPDNDGKEIGLIEDLQQMPPSVREMLNEQMELRYFSPKILKIHDFSLIFRRSYGNLKNA